MLTNAMHFNGGGRNIIRGAGTNGGWWGRDRESTCLGDGETCLGFLVFLWISCFQIFLDLFGILANSCQNFLQIFLGFLWPKVNSFLHKFGPDAHLGPAAAEDCKDPSGIILGTVITHRPTVVFIPLHKPQKLLSSNYLLSLYALLRNGSKAWLKFVED